MINFEESPVRLYTDLVNLRMDVADVKLPVWRRVQVSAFSKLGGIHRVVQAVFGIEASLPHRFILLGDIYKRIAPGEALDAKRERNWRLDSATYPDETFWYEFGSENTCRIRIFLEEYVVGQKHWRYPRCVGGSGNIPPHEEESFDLGRTNRRLWRSVKRQ